MSTLVANRGLLRFVHYAFMPNQLGYCGGDDARALMDYAAAGQTDAGLEPMLRKFSGALPYLKLIARTNGLADPFDERVVEAYWIGNELLERVEMRQLYDDLVARFAGHLPPQALKWVAGKAPAGARPHHNFHVFDVHSRAGDRSMSLATMDACRISWGTVVADLGGEALVERQRLALEDGRLALSTSIVEAARYRLDGRGFAGRLAKGTPVSLHWGWICEVLDADEVSRLRRYTAQHLALANETL